MQIIPLSPAIHTIPAADRIFGDAGVPVQVNKAADEEKRQPETFAEALLALWDNAAEAQAAKAEDMANIMLGDVDSLESLQINIAKAEIATELFVNIKNSVVDAYNEIMRMSI